MTVNRWLIALIIGLVAPTSQAVTLEFDTQLTSLDLGGGPFPMPLVSDPGNNLGDSIDGYGFVDSNVTLALSSQRNINPGPASAGTTIATLSSQATQPGSLPAINPADLDGQSFFVDSFFDVFFDITVTDVDSRMGRDIAGQSDGASIVLQDNGPGRITSLYNAVFDKNAPNFGLFPPAGADPFIGLFLIEIPLGGDINGNGEDDKIKFTIGSFSAQDANRSFIELPDGTVVNQFDTAAFLQGAVVDVSTDPPFTIGGGSPSQPDPSVFGGPTTATSNLLNPVVPIPAAVWLFGSGLIGLIGVARRKKV